MTQLNHTSDLLETASLIFPTHKDFWEGVGGLLKEHHKEKTQKYFLSTRLWEIYDESAKQAKVNKRLEHSENSFTGMSQVFLPWLYTQRIYEIDVELAFELFTKSVDDVPVSNFERLPTWSTAITYSEDEKPFDLAPLKFWIALCEPTAMEREQIGHIQVLRLVQLTPQNLVYLTLRVYPDDTINTMVKRYMARADRTSNLSASEFHLMLSTALYLCTDAADVVATREPDEIRFSKLNRLRRRNKPSTRALKPKKPRVYAVGRDFANKIRQHKAQVRTMEQGGMKPHIRSGHWHTFLAGPRDQPRERRVKWINPILVNFNEAEL